MANNIPLAKKPQYVPSDKAQTDADRAYDSEMAQYDIARTPKAGAAHPPHKKSGRQGDHTDGSFSSKKTSDHKVADSHGDGDAGMNDAQHTEDRQPPHTDSEPAPRVNPSAEYLESLPIRSVMVGGERKVGRYDEKTRYVYLDDGTIVRVTPPKNIQKEPEESDDAEDRSAGQQRIELPEPPRRITDGSAREEDEDNPRSNKAKTRSQKKHDKPSGGNGGKKGVLIAVLAVIIIGSFALQYIGSQTGDEPSQPQQQAEAGPTTEVEVVQLTQDVIAGTPITEDLIEPYVISAESFNEISLSGVNLYQWDRKDMLLGMYVSKYLPRGQYLSYDSLVAAYEPPKNIFGVLEDGEYIDIPITLKEGESSNYVPGSAFDVTIRKSTLVESPETEEGSSIDGMDHTSSVEQSVRIDEYKFSDVIAVDIIAADGSSMYQTFSSLLSIPAGEQAHYIDAHRSDTAFIESVTPAMVRIAASETQIEALGDMTSENTECIFTILADKADKSSDEKADFFANSQVLAHQLQEHIPVTGGGDANE